VKIFEAYKYLPRKGDILRLYEFRGHNYKLSQEVDAAEPSFVRDSRMKYILVLAENLLDAVAHVQKHSPLFFPDRVAFMAKIQAAKAADSGGTADEEHNCA
jgi:hypothetical protein